LKLDGCTGRITRIACELPGHPRDFRLRGLENNMLKFVAVLMLLPFTCIPGIAQKSAEPESVLPAINEIEVWQQVGQQPYEFTWTQREQDPHTLVDFEDMQGWNLELYDGAQGELRRSREQQMWGEYVAKIAYLGVRTKPRDRAPAPSHPHSRGV
jgi:hypothetical protein